MAGRSALDIIIGLFVDDAGFVQDVEAKAKKAGTAGGSALSQGLALGAKVGALAVSGLFAVALKGTVQLDNATAKFRAETGATAEEATKAGHAIAEMSRSNLQGISEIGDTLTLVTKNFGLTGDAAIAATQQILKFATATGQNATEATVAFDDVLDTWHKTAADLPSVMDLIIASTQKYGGTVQDAEAALTSLGPAIQAMGGDMNQAVGFIDLFRASGLDASAAARGLQTALKNLKPGQTLDDLIAQIASIPDPFLRAQEAARIFGTRSGAGLANALHPGITSLEQFGISASDAAGATEKAAGVIEGTFQNQIKLAINNATGALADFGSKFGPLLTTIGTLGPLLGPLLVKGAVSGVKAAGNLLGSIFGDDFISNATSTITGAAGTIIGNLSGQFLALGSRMSAELMKEGTWSAAVITGLQRVFAGMVAKAALITGPAGRAAGAAYQLAVIGTAKLIEGVTSLFTAIGSATGSVVGASTAAGAAAGAAFQAAFIGGLVVLGAVIADKVGRVAGDAFTKAFGLAPLPDAGDMVRHIGERAKPAAQQAGTDTGQTYGTATADAIRTRMQAQDVIDAFFGSGQAAGAAAVAGVAAGVAGPSMADAHKAFQTLFSRKLMETPAAKAGYEAGSALDTNVGQAMRDHADVITSAAKTIRDLLKNGMTPKRAEQIALGAKSVQAFQDGMASHKIGVKQTTRDLLLATLAEFKGTPMDKQQSRAYAKLHGLAFSHGISEADIDAEKAGCKLVNHAHDGTNCIPKSTWAAGGASLSRAWGSGFIATLSQMRAGIVHQVSTIGRSFIPGSPIKEGPLVGIETAGGKLAKAWSDGFIANLGVKGISDALSNAIPKMAMPKMAMPALAMPGLGSMALNVGPAVIRHEFGTLRVAIDGTNLPDGTSNSGIASIVNRGVDDLIRNLRRENAMPLEAS